MNNPVAGWQYKVIHINVESDQATSAKCDTSHTETPFTQTYLEQEFPGYYKGQGLRPDGAAPAAPRQHPAQQLQECLNGHGRQGWMLLGIYPLGTLTMMIFQRPIPTESLSAALSHQAPPHQAAPHQTAPHQTATHQTALPGSGSIEQILRRLEALEARLAGGSNTTITPPAPPINEAACLSAAHLAALVDRPTLNTSGAARALGFRSSASLANLGNRIGYRLGLIKHGSNGNAAVYVGSGQGQRGGRASRLWVVLSQAELAALS